ncbi:MAG: EAL domain-containing protein [Methylococcales bacterium]|nr:EAL domain-containing protein [Methylococcales bacterium]
MELVKWLKPYLATCGSLLKARRDEELRKQSEQEVEIARDFYLSILDNAPILIWRSEPNGQCDWFNSAWLQFTGRTLAQEIGEGWIEGIHPSDLDHCYQIYLDAVHARHPFELEYRLRHHDGNYRWIVDYGKPFHNIEGEFAGFIGYCFDITERKETARQIENLAYFDALTGLPNRAFLQGRISQALSISERDGDELALLFIDLDNFKTINDSLGHSVGDRLLCAVAKQLATCVRDMDTVSRLGGDEFVIILPETGAAGASIVAEKIFNALIIPHPVDEHELSVSASIGISLFPHDSWDFESLLKHADTAMYQAKGAGRSSYQLFTQAMKEVAHERHDMENRLRKALAKQEFVLYYQPQVEIVTGRIIGTEALIRWQNPELGMVFPTKFIPVAEDCGLITPIGRWVLEEACRQNKTWQTEGLPPISIAVNLSPTQFIYRQQHIVDMIADVLNITGMEPQYLEVELTESAVMHDPDGAAQILRQLNAMQVKLAIDDFGTGYSSLSYLKRFPITKLKIDRSFVRDLITDPEDRAIVSAIISMGHSLKLKINAEGMETSEQLEFLRREGCDEAQGYYFSEPLPAGELAKFLRRNSQGYVAIIQSP